MPLSRLAQKERLTIEYLVPKRQTHKEPKEKHKETSLEKDDWALLTGNKATFIRT